MSFSPDYVEARRRFREAVANRGGRLDALLLSAKGPRGEDLTIDIGWFGTSNPRRALVHSSGLHGVEAFAGCAIQLRLLEEGIPPPPEDGAIVLVHVLNPYGMAWLRRFNENSVDLNRNFLGAAEDFSGAPDAYRELNAFLNPATPPSPDLYYFRAAWLIARHGLPKLRQAVAGGQYAYPQGLFFGGKRLEEGPSKFQNYMLPRLSRAARIVAIDVHAGLGKFGDDRLLVDAAPGQEGIGREMRAFFGERVQLLDPSGIAYDARGAHHNLYHQLFPEARTYFATQEFGTYPGVRVLKALRAENRWHHYGAGSLDHSSKGNLREMFNPASEKWRTTVLSRGQAVVRQALRLAFQHSD